LQIKKLISIDPIPERRLIMRSYGLKSMVIMGTLSLILAAGAIPAQAIQIEVDFTATNFTPFVGSIPAPTDPVTGTIIYEAASTTANIESLTSINLTIDNHTYALNEVGFISPFGINGQLIGGIVNGLNGFSSGTDDFDLTWLKGTSLASFIYTSSSTPDGIWTSDTFTSFSVTPVPEPSTILLLCCGMIGLWGARKKFKK
jgi:hypothetical protein